MNNVSYSTSHSRTTYTVVSRNNTQHTQYYPATLVRWWCCILFQTFCRKHRSTSDCYRRDSSKYTPRVVRFAAKFNKTPHMSEMWSKRPHYCLNATEHTFLECSKRYKTVSCKRFNKVLGASNCNTQLHSDLSSHMNLTFYSWLLAVCTHGDLHSSYHLVYDREKIHGTFMCTDSILGNNMLFLSIQCLNHNVQTLKHT